MHTAVGRKSFFVAFLSFFCKLSGLSVVFEGICALVRVTIRSIAGAGNKTRLAVFGFVWLAFFAGCGGQWRGFGHHCPSPRWRKGYYATATPGTVFLGLEDLGIHGASEQNGIVYTCRAGHIDIAHARKAADWSAFLAERTYESLMHNRKEFTFKLLEPSVYFVSLSYPPDWKNRSREQRKAAAAAVAAELGQYFSYTALTWHEILTWFGYRITKIYSEFPSSFSWEDQISNALGTYVAGLAMSSPERDFNKAVTAALNFELVRLGIQPANIAREASEKVRGRWYSGGLYFFVDISKRNPDIGLADGRIDPFLVPDLAGCEGVPPEPYAVPHNNVSGHGFSAELRIEPREIVRDRILSIISASGLIRRIDPDIHFAEIIKYIRMDAAWRYGPGACEPH